MFGMCDAFISCGLRGVVYLVLEARVGLGSVLGALLCL